jgi:hypothetical protein
MSSPDTPEKPANHAEGPTAYQGVPRYRRSDYCSAVILAHVAVMVFGGCLPVLVFVGIFTTLGVLAVCVVVLTGPVYYNTRREDGTLRTWSAANKVAAVILLLLFVGGYGGLVYYLAVNRKLG